MAPSRSQTLFFISILFCERCNFLLPINKFINQQKLTFAKRFSNMQYRKPLIVAFSISALVILAAIVKRINFVNRFKSQVKELFFLSKRISDQSFSVNQLEGLPEPVQRYFRLVLREGQPYISYVRLTHTGKFKTSLKKKWISIKGEQYYTIDTPGYIWKGTTAFFTARDFYIADKGELIVTLLSVFNIVDGSGPSFDQGELLRWLAEGVWFPTALLPSDRLQWSVVDNSHSKLVFNYKELTLDFLVTFNRIGEIVEMKTQRYMDKNIIETWVCKMHNYRWIYNVKVPTHCEVSWRLAARDFPYADFKIKKIEYNIPAIL